MTTSDRAFHSISSSAAAPPLKKSRSAMSLVSNLACESSIEQYPTDKITFSSLISANKHLHSPLPMIPPQPTLSSNFLLGNRPTSNLPKSSWPHILAPAFSLHLHFCHAPISRTRVSVDPLFVNQRVQRLKQNNKDIYQHTALCISRYILLR